MWARVSSGASFFEVIQKSFYLYFTVLEHHCVIDRQIAQLRHLYFDFFYVEGCNILFSILVHSATSLGARRHIQRQQHSSVTVSVDDEPAVCFDAKFAKWVALKRACGYPA